MAHPRFSIGIDLGTTNCAMAFEELGTVGRTARTVPHPAMGNPHAIL